MAFAIAASTSRDAVWHAVLDDVHVGVADNQQVLAPSGSLAMRSPGAALRRPSSGFANLREDARFGPISTQLEAMSADVVLT
jgi:hypothetical protein